MALEFDKNGIAKIEDRIFYYEDGVPCNYSEFEELDKFIDRAIASGAKALVRYRQIEKVFSRVIDISGFCLRNKTEQFKLYCEFKSVECFDDFTMFGFVIQKKR